jgi:hypothetical protein
MKNNSNNMKSLWNQRLASVFWVLLENCGKLREQNLKRAFSAVQFLAQAQNILQASLYLYFL